MLQASNRRSECLGLGGLFKAHSVQPQGDVQVEQVDQSPEQPSLEWFNSSWICSVDSPTGTVAGQVKWVMGVTLGTPPWSWLLPALAGDRKSNSKWAKADFFPKCLMLVAGHLLVPLKPLLWVVHRGTKGPEAGVASVGSVQTKES